MDRRRLDKWCEWGILLVVVVASVAAPLALGAVRPGEFGLLQCWLALGVVLWALRPWLSPDYRLHWSPLCWLVLAFMGYAAVRYLQADVEHVARLECLRLLVYGLLFFLILNNLHRQDSTHILLATVLGVGTLISLYALYQFLTGSDQVLGFVKPPAFRGRGSGTFICPNHLAGYLEMLIPVALAIVILSRRGALARILAAYAALMMAAGLAVSVSRGGYLAAGVALCAFAGVLFQNRGFRRYVWAGLMVAVALGAIFLATASGPQKRLRLMFAGGQQENALGRLDLWRPTTRMWLDHPWFGVGPGHFDVRFPAYRPAAIQSRPYWAHNDYLNVLADWGAVGGLVLAGGLACLLWTGWRTWRFVRRDGSELVARTSDRAAAVLGLGIGLLAFALHALVDFNWQIPANAMLGVTFAALLTSHLRFTSNRYWWNPRRIGWAVLGLVTGAAAILLVQQGVLRWREARLVRESELARTLVPQVAALEQAVRLDPANADTRSRLGELLRRRSWAGDPAWRAAAEEAWTWFESAMARNRWDTFPLLHGAMTLDWLARHDEAAALFQRAVELDPNNHYVALLRGWHEMQVSNWVEAKRWLERSIEILPWSNWLAFSYLEVVNRRLAEQQGLNRPGASI
jgi:O-antigen ligase